MLSGAKWPPMPGRYFPGGAPPMLFTQGSADTINPPSASLQLYRADGADARYYLDLALCLCARSADVFSFPPGGAA